MFGRALDDSKLARCCEMLTGTHDYSPFVHKEARNDRDNRMAVTRFDYDRTKFKFNRDDGGGGDGVDEKSSSEASVWEVRFVVSCVWS